MDGSSFVKAVNAALPRLTKSKHRRHCRAACRTPGHGWPGRVIRSRERLAMDGRDFVIEAGQRGTAARPRLDMNEATSDPTCLSAQ
jgi:hypothetical protein